MVAEKGPILLGPVVLGCMREKTGEVLESKPEIRAPIQSLIQFLTPAS